MISCRRWQSSFQMFSHSRGYSTVFSGSEFQVTKGFSNLWIFASSARKIKCHNKDKDVILWFKSCLSYRKDTVRNYYQGTLRLLPSKSKFSNVTEDLALQLLKDINIDKAVGIDNFSGKLIFKRWSKYPSKINVWTM